jgi:hypothetical protein
MATDTVPKVGGGWACAAANARSMSIDASLSGTNRRAFVEGGPHILSSMTTLNVAPRSRAGEAK